VDEAHNARTDLSFATLGNVLPSCIVEFTATPAREKTPSNVLHRVSAAELKTAQMVKLLLRVVTRHPSQRDQLLAEAITLRADLERLAVLEGQQTAEYIRPILLIQAERVDACEPLRDRLVREFGFSQDEVKISVGRLDELKGMKDISLAEMPGPGDHHGGKAARRMGLPLCLCALQLEGNLVGHRNRANRRAYSSAAECAGEATS